MKKALNASLLLLVASNLMADTVITKQRDSRLRAMTLLNSLNVGLGNSIRCNFEETSETKAVLKNCYSNNIVNFYTLGYASDLTGISAWTVKSADKIILDTKRCSLSMNGYQIGEYYLEGLCDNTFHNQGIRITKAYVTINEVDQEIRID